MGYALGHRSYGEGSSRSHAEKSSSSSYRTVVDSRDKEKRAERSHGDRGRKSRSTKKEKDKRKERRRYVLPNFVLTMESLL